MTLSLSEMIQEIRFVSFRVVKESMFLSALDCTADNGNVSLEQLIAFFTQCPVFRVVILPCFFFQTCVVNALFVQDERPRFKRKSWSDHYSRS